MVQKILYLFGAGSTKAELILQAKEGETLMRDLANYIYDISRENDGPYFKLVQDFSLDPSNQDIELIISLLESSEMDFDNVLNELKQLYRKCLVDRITKAGINPKITTSLLRIHRTFGPELGENGEEFLGIITTNNDCLIEKAFCNEMTYSGLNCCFDCTSDEYNLLKDIPPVLKLHGSFNWILSKEKNLISDAFETETNTDFSGWVAPSVYKKEHLVQPIFRDIWKNARELLLNCDVLRIVGSSLRTEDLPLLSLIFSSQVISRDIKKKAFEIQLITRDSSATRIIERLGFFVNFRRLSDLAVYDEEIDSNKESNPYYYWITRIVASLESKGVPVGDDPYLKETLFGETNS